MPTPRMEAATTVSPLTVLTLGTLRRLLPDHRLQALHAESPRGWTRELAIEALFWLVVQVAAGARRSVFASFQADQAAESTLPPRMATRKFNSSRTCPPPRTACGSSSCIANGGRSNGI